MSYLVIVRGPLGVGKTTVSEKLAGALLADYHSIDRILDEHGLWEAGRLKEFIAANEIVAPLCRASLAKGRSVVVDGNFYWKSQIRDLLRRLDTPHYVFTLKAPLSVCIERDGRRRTPHGPEAASVVYSKSTAFDYGVGVDAAQSVAAIVRKIATIIAGKQPPSWTGCDETCTNPGR